MLKLLTRPTLPEPTQQHAFALWSRLCSYDFDRTGSLGNFCLQLTKKHGWSAGETSEFLNEYRKFCFLVCMENGPLTPSRVVDEVWHAHLLCSREYWTHFCPKVLGQDLHHDGDKGLPSETEKHYYQYAQTLLAYTKWFGTPHHAAWPPARQQFSVKTKNKLFLPKLLRRFFHALSS